MKQKGTDVWFHHHINPLPAHYMARVSSHNEKGLQICMESEMESGHVCGHVRARGSLGGKWVSVPLPPCAAKQPRVTRPWPSELRLCCHTVLCPMLSVNKLSIIE
ncbi:jg15891 [Pararge aegeria aegeria]|uniref:Jg15891 protein n=1 Tax=Pararge aegeria aegeria TaxID=348720 RepID=A0A8S4SFZ2_9NEOP|nr:jg15891 [Pararge aegeria aegeria]